MENKKYHEIPEEYFKNEIKRLEDVGHPATFISEIYKKLVAEFPSKEINKSEWVSVKDRLPEFEMEVIMSHEKDLWVAAGYISRADGSLGKWYNQFQSYQADDSPVHPSHWMPLPSPPKPTHIER